jgi:hypothetical protein
MVQQPKHWLITLQLPKAGLLNILADMKTTLKQAIAALRPEENRP